MEESTRRIYATISRIYKYNSEKIGRTEREQSKGVGDSRTWREKQRVLVSGSQIKININYERGKKQSRYTNLGVVLENIQPYIARMSSTFLAFCEKLLNIQRYIYEYKKHWHSWWIIEELGSDKFSLWISFTRSKVWKMTKKSLCLKKWMKMRETKEIGCFHRNAKNQPAISSLLARCLPLQSRDLAHPPKNMISGGFGMLGIQRIKDKIVVP